MLAARLAAGAEVRADLPGPLGLPGGYPVRIQDGRITLDLPDGLTTEDALAWQMRMAEHDGVVVTTSGDVRFGERARRALSAQLADIPHRYEAQDMELLARQLLRLREKLRAEPAA